MQKDFETEIAAVRPRVLALARKNPDIEKVLDKMPGVKLSKDGTICVNGEKGSSITINDKTY